MSNKICYHCGDDVIGKGISYDDKSFCCNGCKSVYELLSENQLDNFYSLEQNSGVKPSQINAHKYSFLDVPEIKTKYIDFENDKMLQITLSLPSIHCSSCIYLLENLQRIDKNVIDCEVNFTKRQAVIRILPTFKLSELAVLLDQIGYAPNFSSQKEVIKKKNKTYLYKLGVAGFAFGSIMLWSFPEYLGIEDNNPEFRSFTSYLSLLVSIPVLLYSANEYLISAYKVIRNKSINLDVPISIGIIALYGQSCWQIISSQGPGYMDSFAGFVFFLLIGKWFQSKSYDSLAFDRDYSSYFPVAVTRINSEISEIVEIEKVEPGDTILLRNDEVLPCDSKLESDECMIDYSFVTGESDTTKIKKGDHVFAGGKIIGPKTLFKVSSKSNRSKLTQLWNKNNAKANKEQEADKTSIFFLLAVLIIALVSGIIWWSIDSSRVTEIVVAILIVACPCALALSKPFTFGNIMRVLGRKGLYLKSTEVIEDINKINTVVFDKTGTLTTGSNGKVQMLGEPNSSQLEALILLSSSNTHPLSRKITSHIKNQVNNNIEHDIIDFSELSGQGVSGIVNQNRYKLGSAQYTGIQKSNQSSSTFFTENDVLIAEFSFQSEPRNNIEVSLKALQEKYNTYLLSGDNEKDLDVFKAHFKSNEHLLFNQSPQEKLEFIKKEEQKGNHILMIGDGLNDSGALLEATVGFAVSEDVFRFTPNADAILDAQSINRLHLLLKSANYSNTILAVCYLFSILYNIIGLGFAISGQLTPLVAAILMPLSSISIVLISTFLSRFLAK